MIQKWSHSFGCIMISPFLSRDTKIYFRTALTPTWPASPAPTLSRPRTTLAGRRRRQVRFHFIYLWISYPWFSFQLWVHVQFLVKLSIFLLSVRYQIPSGTFLVSFQAPATPLPLCRPPTTTRWRRAWGRASTRWREGCPTWLAESWISCRY